MSVTVTLLVLTVKGTVIRLGEVTVVLDTGNGIPVNVVVVRSVVTVAPVATVVTEVIPAPVVAMCTVLMVNDVSVRMLVDVMVVLAVTVLRMTTVLNRKVVT